MKVPTDKTATNAGRQLPSEPDSKGVTSGDTSELRNIDAKTRDTTPSVTSGTGKTEMKAPTDVVINEKKFSAWLGNLSEGAWRMSDDFKTYSQEMRDACSALGDATIGLDTGNNRVPYLLTLIGGLSKFVLNEEESSFRFNGDGTEYSGTLEIQREESGFNISLRRNSLIGGDPIAIKPQELALILRNGFEQFSIKLKDSAQEGNIDLKRDTQDAAQVLTNDFMLAMEYLEQRS